MNDLDETLPAPWEWDLKRLAASIVIACRDNGLSESDAKDAVLGCVRSYREHMAEFYKMAVLDLWYFALDAEMLIATIEDPGIRRRAIKRLAKARESSTSEGIFPKLVDDSGGSPFFKDQLPAIFHWKDHAPGEVHPDVRQTVDQYRETLTPAHRMLLDRYDVKDAAFKVVGVGSVGTGCCGSPVDVRRRRTSHSPGQGGAGLGPGGLCGEERLPEPRTACREWPSGSCSRPATSSSAGPRVG